VSKIEVLPPVDRTPNFTGYRIDGALKIGGPHPRVFHEDEIELM